jgi:uncharacterized protein (TIGR02118 family)
MIKATVLYGHPANAEAFEKYYSGSHLPLVAKVQGIVKKEWTKFLPNPDGSAAAYYRMAELYFAGPGEMQQTLRSPEGKAMAADLANFASGGVTIIFGQVEN